VKLMYTNVDTILDRRDTRGDTDTRNEIQERRWDDVVELMNEIGTHHKPYVIHYQANLRINVVRMNAATAALDAVPAKQMSWSRNASYVSNLPPDGRISCRTVWRSQYADLE
jgi:hypothetical protein